MGRKGYTPEQIIKVILLNANRDLTNSSETDTLESTKTIDKWSSLGYFSNK